MQDLHSTVCIHDTLSVNPILWRYMDFTKLLSILENKALFFARADKLGDPFEGSVPKSNIASRSILNPDFTDDEIIMYGLIMQQLPRFSLISCWHESPHESEAMWKLYTSVNGGIAIRSNLNSLINSLKVNEKIHIGKVQYVDYENDRISEDDLLFPYLHKRKSFEHEQEVRVIIQKLPVGLDLIRIKERIDTLSIREIDQWHDFCSNGIHYEVELNLLIEEIVIAHFAPEWLLDLVKQVANRYGLAAPINRSVLADTPTW